MSSSAADAEASRNLNLELDIPKIQQQIAALTEWWKTLKSQQHLPQHTVAERCIKIVVDLHHVGEHMTEHTVLEMSKFMELTFTDDVQVNAVRGRQEFRKQGMTLSACFTDVNIGFEDARLLSEGDDKGSDGIVIRATSGFQTMLTEKTLKSTFPQLVQHPALFYKLRGKMLVGTQHVDFKFNCQTKMITRVDIVIDFYAAFLQLLQNQFDMDTLFGADVNPILKRVMVPQVAVDAHTVMETQA